MALPSFDLLDNAPTGFSIAMNGQFAFQISSTNFMAACGQPSATFSAHLAAPLTDKWVQGGWAIIKFQSLFMISRTSP